MSKEMLYVPGAGQGNNNQLMRTLLSLCALAGRPVRMRDLVDDRPRPRPGLGPGGLGVALALAQVTNGYLQAEIGSSDLDFRPDQPRFDDFHFNLAAQRKTDAPIAWLVETLILPLSAAPEPSQAFMSGGTHVLGGPTSDELHLVLIPNLRQLGFNLQYLEVSPGFHPQGEGEAELQVNPIRHCQAWQDTEAFMPQQVGVEVVSAGLPVHLAEQLLEGALARLNLRGFNPSSRLRRSHSGQGQALLIWAQNSKGWRVGFIALGRRGERPEALATEAAENFLAFLKTQTAMPADTAAWLLGPLAAAQGQSCLTVDRLTPNLRAAAQAVETMWPGCIRLDELENGWLLRLTGQNMNRQP